MLPADLLWSRRLPKASFQPRPNFQSTRKDVKYFAVLSAAFLATTIDQQEASCEVPRRASRGWDSMLTAPRKEKATGILFPKFMNGMTLAGCGVRVKWAFV